jgi:DNA-binding IscR family transcriptional regulator
MRLRSSRTADHGLRAALEIARAPTDAPVNRQAIARATDAPASVLAALGTTSLADVIANSASARFPP